MTKERPKKAVPSGTFEFLEEEQKTRSRRSQAMAFHLADKQLEWASVTKSLSPAEHREVKLMIANAVLSALEWTSHEH